MRSTSHVVVDEKGAEPGHYSDPPLLVLASLAGGPKHGHAMIEDIGTLANVVFSGLSEYIFPTRGGTMNQPNSSFGVIVKKPSAFIPLAMSLSALAVLGFAAMSGGLVPQKDEGAAAHLWQLLMAGQVPVLAFFAIKWLPRAPRQSLGVLALQLVAALAAVAPVFLLHL